LHSPAARMLMLASRQSGKSSVAAALALRTVLRQPRSTVLLLGPSLRQSGEIFRKIFNALGRPVGVTAESALRLELANGSGSGADSPGRVGSHSGAGRDRADGIALRRPPPLPSLDPHCHEYTRWLHPFRDLTQ
jgi:hypothetical protein